MGWKTLDTKEVVDSARKQAESTTSANAGGFAVPFGAEPLRPPVLKPKKKKK